MTAERFSIGEKVFSNEDQRFFARLSGDINPMHMDPLVARRLITGRQVVHGVHIMLYALECWYRNRGEPLSSLGCTFSNPVSVGEHVVFAQCGDTLHASVNELDCASVTLVRSVGTMTSGATRAPTPPGSQAVQPLAPLAEPLDEAPEFHLGRHYALNLDVGDEPTQFPGARHCLGKGGLAAALALSYVVGMICPGLHSVFFGIDLQIGGADDDGMLHVRVREYDPRFRLFNIDFHGTAQGSIKAFLRSPPQRQPTMAELAREVVPHEFAGTRALIIGGSRGLGEVTAKLLAVGGADTVITYASGMADAQAVAHEIERSGQSRCDVAKFDLTTDGLDSVPIDWRGLDTVYFFATPRIFRKKADLFDERLFSEFCDFYIARFVALCTFIEHAASDSGIKVYLPSTVFIEDRPKGMAEYAMAKAAAEVLAQEINRSFRKVSVVSTRLPRLSTDQTSSIVKVITGSNVETLLPLLRTLQGRKKQ